MHAGVVENLLNENETLVDAGKAIRLFDADLRRLPGSILRSLGPDGWRETRRLDSLSPWFKEGVYKIKGSFGPSLGYASTTDLEFEIADVSSKATD